MENNNLVNNENSTGAMTGAKLDTSVGTLADHMQVLSLGAPSVSEQKKFNVHAWSTPLKSIENQQQQLQRRRSARDDGIHKTDANAALPEAKLEEDKEAGVADDSLANVTDLLPDQNLFEKTCDFIEYCLTFPAAASNGSRVCDATGAAVSPAQPPIRSSSLVDPTAGSCCSPLSVSRDKEFISESPLEGDCLQRPWNAGGDVDSPVTPVCQRTVLSGDTDSFVLRVSEHDHSSAESVELPSYVAQTPGYLLWPQRVDERSENSPIRACSGGGSDGERVCDEHDADSDTDSTLSENGERSVDPFARRDSPSSVAVHDASSSVDSLTNDLRAHLAIDHAEGPSSDLLSRGNGPEGDSEMRHKKATKVVSDDPSSVECAEMDGGVDVISGCDRGDEAGLLIGHADDGQEEVPLETTNVVGELDGAYETVVGSQSPRLDDELNSGISRSPSSLSSCTMQIASVSTSNESKMSSASVIVDWNDELEYHAEVPSSGLRSVEGEDIPAAEVNAETESHDDELSVATATAHTSRLSVSGITFAEEPTQISLYEVEIVQPEPVVEYSAIGEAAPSVDNRQTSLHDDVAKDAVHIRKIDPAVDIPGTDGAPVASTCSPPNAESAKRVSAELSVCSWTGAVDNDEDESSKACDEKELASPSSFVSSLPPCEGVDDAAEFANDVSVQSAGSLAVDVEGLSPMTPSSNNDVRLSPAAAMSSTSTPPTSEADSSPGGPADDVETCAKNAAAIAEAAAYVHAEVASLTGPAFPSTEHVADAFDDSLGDTSAAASVESDDCYEDCTDSLPPSIATSQCTTVDGDSKTPPSHGSKYDRSFANDDSEGKECERFIDNQQAKKEGDSPMTRCSDVVPVDDAGIASTSAQRSPSKRDDFWSELPTTPLSSFRGRRTSVAVADDCAGVPDPFRAAASAGALSADQPATGVQSEKLVSLPITPARNVDEARGQDVQTDKLSRVCDSMNRLMSLCTPMKDARIRPRTPANPFRCEKVGTEGHKIVFDCPTNLLDVSIGVLESLTALVAPADVAGSNLSCTDRNVASDLVSVAETPQNAGTQSNQWDTLSSAFVHSNRLNVSDMNTRLLEENANLKNDFEEYKRKYYILQDEYESLLKVAFTLRANETELKKALDEYDDEARKSANRYLILKEYATNLIVLQNKCLDRYEEELRSKDEEIRKLKESL